MSTSGDDQTISVVARARAKSGSEAAVRGALRGAANAAPSEAGCISYELFEEKHAAGSFFTVEQWESEAALQTHLDGIKGALARLQPLLDGDVTISVLVPVA